MDKSKDVFRFDFLERGIGNDVNDAAFGVQLGNRVFANIGTLSEFLVGNDLIHLRVDRNAQLQLLLAAFELVRLHFHLAADAAALPVRFALLGFAGWRTRAGYCHHTVLP